MAKPEWGIKRICPNCGTRYYDLRRDPPTCPSCGAVFDPEALLKSRRARPAPVEEIKKARVVVNPDIELDADDEVVAPIEDVAVDDLDAADAPDDEEDVLLEDASELGEDDMGEVMDVEGGDEDEEGR